MDSVIQELQNQISQLAISINRSKSQGQEKLLSQPEVNSKNVSAITLRSGRELEGLELMIPKDKNEDQIEKELEEEGMRSVTPKVISDLMIKVQSNPPPFPNRLEKSKSKTRKRRF